MKRNTLTELNQLAQQAAILQANECPSYNSIYKCQRAKGHPGQHYWQHGRKILEWKEESPLPKKKVNKNRKIPLPEELAKLYETHSISEIAEKYNVTKSGVSDQLRKIDATSQKKDKVIRERSQNIEQLRKEGLTFQEIDKKLGLSSGYSSRLARKYGLNTLLPIGCLECTTKPYAKGLCKNCYYKHLRRKSRSRTCITVLGQKELER